MIGTLFSLSLFMIFMLAVLVTDALIRFQAMREGIERAFSKDSSIFPDHTYE